VGYATSSISARIDRARSISPTAARQIAASGPS
jgi:hypothetical protein